MGSLRQTDAVRICVAYDCLFPWTIGGAERWYRELAERLVESGHEVTYITRQQWPEEDPPMIPGVRVIAVSPYAPLYKGGRRSIAEALRFGWGVLVHLVRRRHDYDVVHTCSFPYFSVLAAATVMPLGRYRLVVDWFEVWSSAYWISYLGAVFGRIGFLVQRLCVAVPQVAHCFSARQATRLMEQGLRGNPIHVGGLYAGQASGTAAGGDGKFVLFAGRMISEKRAHLVVETVSELRRRGTELPALVIGDGPELEGVRRLARELDLEELVEIPGFVSDEAVERAMGQAACLLHPSEREGYGLVVLEAASHGTPSIVVDHPDNASVELIEEGVNGFVSRSADPTALADKVLEATGGGAELRESTARWLSANSRRLSISASLETVVESYGPARR